MPEGAAAKALEGLLRAGKLVALDPSKEPVDGDQMVISLRDWIEISGRIDRSMAGYHTKFPLRSGISREELKSQLGLPSRVFSFVIARKVIEGTVREHQNLVAVPTHRIHFDPAQQAAIDALMQRFENNPYSPPSTKECKDAVGAEVFGALRELEQLVAVSREVVFRRVDYDAMVAGIRIALQTQNQLTLAEVRDLFQTSRKYAQALLEHLDTIGVTRRNGDVRVRAS
jgi:selenocysteine-specific elongation factor